MSRTYQVNQSADVADFVRILVRDAGGSPATGLTIPYILRDAAGASLDAVDAVEISAGASPGWYRASTLVLPTSGTYTVEFAVPAPNVADSDTAVIQVPDTNRLRETVRDTAIIGETYRFNVLFTDRDNAPIDATLPSIHIFEYDPSTGDRTTLVAPGTPLVAVVPPETGRNIYLHVVDAASVEGNKLYAEVQGSDPTPGGLGLIRHDFVLDLEARRVPGLGTSFVG